MKKLSLFLAFALVLAVNSFAEKGMCKVLYYADSLDLKKSNPVSKPESTKKMHERGKDCHFVCKNKKLFLFKGSNVKAIFEIVSFPCHVPIPSSCGVPSNASQVLETCGK